MASQAPTQTRTFGKRFAANASAAPLLSHSLIILGILIGGAVIETLFGTPDYAHIVKVSIQGFIGFAVIYLTILLIQTAIEKR